MANAQYTALARVVAQQAAELDYLRGLIASGDGTTVSVKTYGAKGDGVTDDSAAFQRAVDAAGRGKVLVPRSLGDYMVSSNTAHAISVTADIAFEGDGDASCIRQIGTVTTGGKNMIECSGIGSRVVFRNLKLVAPALSGSSSVVDNTGIFHSSTTTGTVVLENCYIKGFAYGVRTWSGGTHRIDARDSRIEGAGFITPGSMGIHLPGALGAELLVDNCDFSLTGETADTFHCHCIYIYEPVAYDVKNSRFDNVKGRYLQSFSGTGKPRFARITDCYFGPNIPVDVQGVITNNQVPTVFDNCIFDHPGFAVQVEGDAVFNDCEMRSTAGTTFYPAIAATQPNCRVTIDGGIWPITNQFVIKLEAANTRLKVRGVQFTGAAYSQISCRNGCAGSVVEVEDCAFFDNSTGGRGIEIAMTTGALTLALKGNRFQTTKDAVNSNYATAVIRAFFNDFSQTGASIGGTAPTVKKYVGNFGSIGLADA